MSVSRRRRPSPLPEPAPARDHRDRPRQLTFSDTGAMYLPPKLAPELADAISSAQGAAFCTDVWCDRRPVVVGRWCEEHAPREELSAAIARDLRVSPRRRKLRGR